MNIRHGTIDDAKMLSKLGARTFFDTFAKDNTPENIEAYLKKSFSPEIQFKELSQPDTVFLIAEVEEYSGGYAQLILNSRDEAIKGVRPLEIRSIYAAKEYLGKGVGKAPMTAIIDEARKKGCDSIWLGVWKKIKGQSIFTKNRGFKKLALTSFWSETILKTISYWNWTSIDSKVSSVILLYLRIAK